MDMQDILSKVITSTNEIFEAEAGSVALLDPGSQQLVIRAAVGAGADAVRGLRIPANKGIVGWVLAHEKPALVPDVSHDSRFYQAVDESSGFQTRSVMCVPMQTDGRTIGVIELMNMRPDYIGENGLKILSVIADHAALALENSRLLAETRQKSEEQALLFNAMTIVTSDLALETVLDAVSRQMAGWLQAELCLISRWERETDKLYLMQSFQGSQVQDPERTVISLDETPHYRVVLETQTPCLLESGQADLSPAELRWLSGLEVQSLLLIPLVYRRQTIGLVKIGRTRSTGLLAPGDLRLVEMMSAQAAVAIEHARLYDEATRRLAEARVLQEVMVAAASSLDFDRVLSGTIVALHRTLGIERLGFFIPSADGRSVICHPAAVGFDLQENASNFPLERSAAGWVIAHGKSLLLPDVHQSAYSNELLPDTRAKICVPVVVRGQVAAVLNAESPRLNAFDQEDLRLFNAIAAELAVALANARLFQEVRAAEASYRDLFDNANDLIITLDENFRIDNANKMTLQTSGYSLAELRGVPITHFVPADRRQGLHRLFKAHLTMTQLTGFELPIRGKNNQEILLEVTMRIQRRDRRPVGVQCIARDITQRRELEQQLQQTEKLSAIGKLVAGVAHELNNPLTAIIGYADLLQSSDLPPVYQSDLEVIGRQAQRARLIVRNLLTFARKVYLEARPTDINEIINASLLAMKPNLQAHGVLVVSSLDPDLPITMADAHQLEQVFINLITNATQALNNVDGVRRLRIESQRLGQTIRLRFADNGPGIPEMVLHRIFDPFFSTKTVGEGTGLGLSICFGIISEHKGRIWAENAVRGGAVFNIELPIVAPPPVQILPAAAPSLPEAALPPLRILAVDDEQPLLNLIARVLRPLGHEVDTVPDATSALAKLKNQVYDLVICDVLMPDLLGPELYEQAIQLFPRLDRRFIFITGNAIDLDTRTFLEQSGLPWLAKPFLPADITGVVRQAFVQTLDDGA